MLDDCVTTPEDIDISVLAPCTQEEADSRIFLHVAAATLAGHRNIIVRSCDSDVVVLSVATFVRLEANGIEELWVAFGVRRHFR